MPCCGQGRAALAEPATVLRIPPPAPPASPAVGAAAPPSDRAPAGPLPVRVRYTRQERVRVGGPVSGRSYEFSGVDAVQSVDSRDADGLVSTGFFRRVY